MFNFSVIYRYNMCLLTAMYVNLRFTLLSAVVAHIGLYSIYE